MTEYNSFDMDDPIELIEVPGALERPAGCAVRVYRVDNAVTIEIPPRGASLVMWLAAGGLTVVLCAWLFMGGTLMITGKPVFILAAIMNHGLTPAMYKHRFLIGGLVFIALAFGAAELLSMIRHNTSRERVVFGQTGVRHVRLFGRTEKVREHPYETVRSFVLKQDPHGISPARLMCTCQNEEHEVGEFLRNGDREWLCSVCNRFLVDR